MNREIEMSIIIPVYNIEDYLEKNIISLLKMKSDHMEFIYVNDGSTDGSLELLEQYAKQDGRIRIITQKNRGLSAARNTGIDAARGKWILFVDGDDWVEPYLVEELFTKIEDDNDVIWGAYEKVDISGNKEGIMRVDDSFINVNKAGIEWMVGEQVTYAPWIYLCKADVLRKNNILFPMGLFHEDMEFIPKLFYYAKKIKYTGIPFYKYVTRSGSISRVKNIKRSLDLIKIAERLEAFEDKEVTDIEYKNCLKNYRGKLCAEALHIAVLDGVDLKEIFENNAIRESVMIRYMKSSNRKRDKIAGLILQYRWYGIYIILYKVYNKLHKIRMGD